MIGVLIGLIAELGLAAVIAVAPVWSYSHHWGVIPFIAMTVTEILGVRALLTRIFRLKSQGALLPFI